MGQSYLWFREKLSSSVECFAWCNYYQSHRKKTLKTRLCKSILPILVTIVGMLSYARNPRKIKVIQQLIGLQLWLGGVKRDVGSWLNVIDLCQRVDATLTTIDGLIKDSSKSVHEWKDAVTSYLCRPQSHRRLFEDDSDEDGWIDEDDNSIPASFSLVFDNVNQKTHAGHQSTTHKNTMLNMVQAYATKDRIGSFHLFSQQPIQLLFWTYQLSHIYHPTMM